MKLAKIFDVVSQRPFFICGIIFLLGSLVYGHSLFFELTYLDDNVILLDRHAFFADLRQARAIWQRPDFISETFYRPLLSLSFMWDAQWSGQKPLGYHATTLMIHLINSCLIFFLVKSLRYAALPSFLAALVFTIHPALTQAVCWIPGRTDSLLGLFVFLSLLLLFSAQGKRRWLFYAGHAFFFLLALFVKETAVVVPVLGWLYVFLFQKNLLTEKKERWARNFIFFGWGFSLGVWWTLRHAALSQSPAIPFQEALRSLGHNLPALVSYFGKAIFPVNLSSLPYLPDLSFVPGILALGFVGFGLWRSRFKRTPYLILAVAWFFLFLLPSLVLSFIKHEYRLYLPLVGVLILFLEMDAVKNFSGASWRSVMGGAGVLSVLVVLNVAHSQHFNGSDRFWQNAVEASPHSALAHRNLGAMYYLKGLPESARQEFLAARTLNPQEPMVHTNLGLIEMDVGHLSAAEELFLKEVALYPRYDNGYYNLGVLYFRQGRLEEATRMWQKTLTLNPYHPLAKKVLGLAASAGSPASIPMDPPSR